jgi:ankyrin repeat protein
MITRLSMVVAFISSICSTQLCFSMEKLQSGEVLEKSLRVLTFLDAIHERNLNALNTWLATGYKDTEIIGQGLCYAAQEGNEAVVRRLLEANVPVYAEEKSASHPVIKDLPEKQSLPLLSKALICALRLAAVNGHEAIVSLLWNVLEQSGSDVLEKAQYGLSSLLQEVIENNHLAVFHVLRKQLSRDSRHNLLQWAALTGRLLELICLLDDADADLDRKSSSSTDFIKEQLLRNAAQEGHAEMVHYLLSKGIRDEDRRALWRSVYKGGDRRALWGSVYNGHAAVVRILFEVFIYTMPEDASGIPHAGDSEQHGAIMKAIERGYVEVIELLLSTHMLTESKYLLPAVKTGNLRLVQAFCKNSTRWQGIRALVCAASLLHWEIAEFLLIKLDDELMKAAYYADLEKVSVCLKRHPVVNLSFMIALELAVCRGNISVIEILLRYPIKRRAFNELLLLASGMPNVNVAELLPQFKMGRYENNNHFSFIANNADYRFRDSVELRGGDDGQALSSSDSSMDIETTAPTQQLGCGINSEAAVELADFLKFDVQEPPMDQAATNREGVGADPGDVMSKRESERGVDDDEKDFLEPAIKNAISLNRLAVLKVLLKWADTKAKDNAFLYAARVGNERALMMLLTQHILSQAIKDEACNLAALANRGPALKILLRAGISNAALNNALLKTGKAQQIEAFKKLIQYPLGGDEEELKEATTKREEILKILRATHYWDGPPFPGNYPDYPKLVRFLEFHFGGALARYTWKANQNRMLPRWLDYSGEAKRFIENPLDCIRSTQLFTLTSSAWDNESGQTFLMLALLLDQQESFNMLLEAGFPDYFINASDGKGYSASDYAGCLGRLDYLEPLIKKGYAKKSLNRQITALLRAARFAADNNHNHMAFAIVYNILAKLNGWKIFQF